MSEMTNRPQAGVKIRIGIDWGGPIAQIWYLDPTTKKLVKYPLDQYHLRPEEPGAIDVIRQLVERFGAENVFIIRNAYGPRGEKNRQKEARRLTRVWFNTSKFFTRTGIIPDHVLYPRTRRGKQLACRRLGITHLVEDRAEVAMHLTNNTRWIAYNSSEEDLEQFLREVPDKVLVKSMPARNWSEVWRYITDPAVMEAVRMARIMKAVAGSSTARQTQATVLRLVKTIEAGASEALAAQATTKPPGEDGS